MNHHLLPQPKTLLPDEGTFTIDHDSLIVIPTQANDEAFFAARQLQDEIRQVTYLEIPIVKSLTPPDHAVRLICSQEQATAFGVDAKCPQAPASTADQAYSLTVTPDGITLYADAPTGLFYAVQTLRQLVRLYGVDVPALTIQDWPTLPYRGLMLDISRGKVPTLETLKELVAKLSHYKVNVLQFYTEHTFQFPRHPKIGAGSGSLSSQDILELDAFCHTCHVELMPNLQSFGHARNTLLVPEYQHLAETDLLWTLSPAFEETYTLLDELYGDMIPAFTSTTLNVNCDETWDLGQGASKALAEEFGVGRVYLNHILRVRELAARYGCHIQIWGDILLHHPELIGEVPEDITLLDWQYAAAEEYPTARIFGESGHTFWICPGTSSWNSLFPRIHNANVNIRNFVRDGVTAGAEGMLNTDWGDYGHYQYLGLSWYGYIFGAAQGWSGGTTTDEAFEAAFGPLFFGPAHEQILDVIHKLDHINTLPGVPQPNGSNTALALFDEPLKGETVASLPPETVTAIQSLAEEASAALDELPLGHPRELTLLEMASAARLIAYAARKTALSQQIRQDLRAPDLDAGCIHQRILAFKALDKELEQLRAEFETLWLARSRRSEIHITLGYYAKLRTRYQAAIAWLKKQQQVLSKGQPVDAGLNTYEAGDHRVLWQTWPDW
ncbi:MAG: family 20 glycosylhydrolase [Anaerolineae bacterium]|nr:family 20 glycosylhydrolase [Anaerolineae bacterium]